MQYLQISNKGEIDPRALTLHGASTKRDEADLIGKFGSGNKYALAVLLRLGHEIVIWSGTRHISIDTKLEVFRDKEFRRLIIDGELTSITVETGPDWTLQDAVREFWCNALDEGEASRALVEYDADHDWFMPVEGKTSILISMSEELQLMLDNWAMYFITSTPIFECPTGSIHLDRPTNFFRRGVWICEDRNVPAHFSYNFTDIDLPESRKIGSGQAYYSLPWLLCKCDVPEVIEKVLLLSKSSEKNAEWEALRYMCSPAMGKTLQAAILAKGYSFIGDISAIADIPEYEHSLVFWMYGPNYEVLVKRGVSSIHKEKRHTRPYITSAWPIGLEKRVKSELHFLAQFSIDYSMWDVCYATFKSSDMIAMADLEEKICVIGDAAITASPDMLRKALIEEWTHLKYNVRDCSVEQQHVYLDLIVSLMK